MQKPEIPTRILSGLIELFDKNVTPGNMDLFSQLSDEINHLIHKDFNKLVTILYKIDVSEEKVKRLLKERVGEDAGVIIAGLLIQRQQEKKDAGNKTDIDKTIPEDEKW